MKLFLLIDYMKTGYLNNLKNTFFVQLIQEHITDETCDKTRCDCTKFYEKVKYNSVDMDKKIAFYSTTDIRKNLKKQSIKKKLRIDGAENKAEFMVVIYLLLNILIIYFISLF